MGSVSLRPIVKPVNVRQWGEPPDFRLVGTHLEFAGTEGGPETR
jgi:hypothetical protein